MCPIQSPKSSLLGDTFVYISFENSSLKPLSLNFGVHAAFDFKGNIGLGHLQALGNSLKGKGPMSYKTSLGFPGQCLFRTNIEKHFHCEPHIETHMIMDSFSLSRSPPFGNFFGNARFFEGNAQCFGCRGQTHHHSLMTSGHLRNINRSECQLLNCAFQVWTLFTKHTKI